MHEARTKALKSPNLNPITEQPCEVMISENEIRNLEEQYKFRKDIVVSYWDPDLYRSKTGLWRVCSEFPSAPFISYLGIPCSHRSSSCGSGVYPHLFRLCQCLYSCTSRRSSFDGTASSHSLVYRPQFFIFLVALR